MTGDKRFSWQLALMDALPVAFFGAGALTVGARLESPLFLCGALTCVVSGMGKVVWKLLIALADKDVKLLGAQLRYVMPAGFALLVAGALMADRKIALGLLSSAVRLPSVMFFGIGVVGICAMIVCARRFDRYDVCGNWIEQCINSLAQACFFLGVLFLG